MSNEGWIKAYRSLLDHWIWGAKPFSYGQAWLDILLRVNHKRARIAFDSTFIIVEPGEMVTSLRKLGERWGWDKEAVRRFLDLLRSDAMLDFSSDSRKTVLRVANWERFQVQAENPRQYPDSPETVPDTNKNDNNAINTLSSELAVGKPDAKRSASREVKFAPGSNPYKAAEYMAKCILGHTPTHPQLREGKYQATLQRWAADIDKLLRIDKVPFDEFKAVLRFSQNDTFWQQNILSGKKLREQYGTLLVRMNTGGDGSD